MQGTYRTPPNSPRGIIETAIAFRDKEKAFAYERYLKTGAGRAYAIKHF